MLVNHNSPETSDVRESGFSELNHHKPHEKFSKSVTSGLPGGYRESVFQEVNELNDVRYNKSLDPNTKRNLIQSIKKGHNQHAQDCSSTEVVLGLINCLNGPNHFLMGIQFYSGGIISMISILSQCKNSYICVTNLFLGFVLGKTADLTQRHAKRSENEYLVTIKRILGKKWEKLYFVASVLGLLTLSIVFVLTGCDGIYSAIRLISSNPETFPDEGTPTFDAFSYQYVGLIFIVVELFLITPKNLTWLFRITSYATYFSFFGVLFVIIVGIHDVIVYPPSFTTSGPSTMTSLSLFGTLKFTDLIYSIGFFETSYQVHNEVVNLLRTAKYQEKNTRDLFISFRILQAMYIVTGVLGSFIVYHRTDGSTPINTILSLFTNSDPTFIWILAIINQILLGLQTVVLAALLIFIFRSQIFTLMYGEENTPPEWVYHTTNAIILIILYIVEVFNYQPATAMALSGAFLGLILMYIVPVFLHLKCLNLQTKKEYNQVLLRQSEMNISLASVVTKHKSKLPRGIINILYTLLIIQGVVTLIGVIIYIFT